MERDYFSFWRGSIIPAQAHWSWAQGVALPQPWLSWCSCTQVISGLSGYHTRVGFCIWSSCWRGPTWNPKSVRGLAVFVLNFDYWDAGDGRGPAGTFPFIPLPRWLHAASPGSLSRGVLSMQLMHLPHGLRLPLSLLWSSVQHCNIPL